jgi:hypothetical protein
LGDELLEPVGEDVAGDAEVALHLAVAPDAEVPSRRMRNVQRSLRTSIASSTASRGGRTGVVVSLGQLVRDLAWIVSETGFRAQPYRA